MASNGPEQAALAPMSKWNKDALICLEKELKINLNLDELTDSLERPVGFMTEVEKISVCEETKQRDKVGRIIFLLRRKGDRDFDIFVKLLKESGNEVWAGQLEEKAGQFRREALGGGWSGGWGWVGVSGCLPFYTVSITCSVRVSSRG